MAYAIPVPAETAVLVGLRRKDDGRAETDEPKRARRLPRAHAVEDLPDHVIAAILAAEPPAEAAQYNWELTAEDGADT